MLARWPMLAAAAVACCVEAKAPPAQQISQLASLGPNFQWNCQTGAGKFKRPGHCGKVNRSMASFELINEFDIGIVTDFLPTDSARAILEKMKTLPASEWVQIDNRAARRMGNSKRAFKPQVDMDYKMYDLNTESHREMRSWVEPLFAPYFQGKGQQLSLFLGKYQHGSYVTAHTDGAVVTLNGDDRFERKRAFLLYLNDGWTEDDGGLFTDEEDTGHPQYTPVKAHKVRWSIYGWSLEPQTSGFAKFVGRMTTEPLFAFSVVFGFLLLCFLLKLVAPPTPPHTMKKE